MGNFFTDTIRDSNSHEFEERVDPITCTPNEEPEVQVLMMSHSITFHSVYFELSTVPKRGPIEGSRALQSSSVFSRYLI